MLIRGSILDELDRDEFVELRSDFVASKYSAWICYPITRGNYAVKARIDRIMEFASSEIGL